MNARPDRQTWDRVTDLAFEITNAAMKDEAVKRRRAYRRLKAIVQQQERSGTVHPWVIETLADFTLPDMRAVILYRRALALARRARLPKQSLLLELGRRHLTISGKRGMARRYLSAAQTEAKRRRDRGVAAEATELLGKA